MDRITPDGHKPHQELELDVTRYLEENGYLVDSAPYHEKMLKPIVHRLENIYTPTALYLRGRADRIAVHIHRDTVFEWEAKTHGTSQWHNMAIEALPLARHIHKAEFDVKTLYCYRDPTRGYEIGFWTNNIPSIWKVVMPTRRWPEELIHWYEEQISIWYPGIQIQRIRGTNKGSNDPFVLIKESIVKVLPHWKKLIEETEDI